MSVAKRTPSCIGTITVVFLKPGSSAAAATPDARAARTINHTATNRLRDRLMRECLFSGNAGTRTGSRIKCGESIEIEPQRHQGHQAKAGEIPGDWDRRSEPPSFLNFLVTWWFKSCVFRKPLVRLGRRVFDGLGSLGGRRGLDGDGFGLAGADDDQCVASDFAFGQSLDPDATGRHGDGLSRVAERLQVNLDRVLALTGACRRNARLRITLHLNLAPRSQRDRLPLCKLHSGRQTESR